jgi:hypothetical protein
MSSVSDRVRDEHERGLAGFVRASRRARFTASLDSAKARAKLRRRLAHFADLDERWLTAVPALPAAAERVWIVRALRDGGAPRRCYLVSENPDLDGKCFDLEDALAEVLGRGFGTLISCVPGEVAFFEGEEPNARWVLSRP